MTCLVFKTTCIDRGKPLREGAFSFTEMALFPPQDKRNTRDKAKSLRIASERYIGEPGVRYHSKWGAGLAATVSDDEPIGIGQIQLPPLYTRHMGYSGGRGEEVTSSLRSGKSLRGLSCVASQGRSAGGHSPRRSSAYRGGSSHSAGAVHRAPYSREPHRGGHSQGR